MFTYQKTLALALLATAAMALVSPKAARASENTAATVYRGPNGPMPVNQTTSRFSAEADEYVGQVCMYIYSQDPGWYYANTGVWGSATGTFGSLNNHYLCVPTNDQAGGAFYVGPSPNPGPGSTKFECFFPTSGNAYCDISVVDGYSLSILCAASSPGGSNVGWGGAGSFYTQGNSCPQKQGANCINTNGYAPSQSDVAAFFQYGVQDSNTYCIWKNCPIPGVFDVSDSITCVIGGGGY